MKRWAMGARRIVAIRGRMRDWTFTASRMPWRSASMLLPKYELYEEGSQARRSSKSVSSQIVEGHALRQYHAEYLHYLARSYGSAEETVEHLQYLLETCSASRVEDECRSLLQEYAVLCRKLYNYMQSVDRESASKRRVRAKP